MSAANLLTGLAVGAGCMYFFDPNVGRRRRKLVADQCNHLLNQAMCDLDASFRDLTNRTVGTVAQAQSMLLPDNASDETIIQRVRSVMGHHVSNPADIDVVCSGGHVILRGPALRSECDELLGAIATVKGVRTVSGKLELHDNPAAIPSLQQRRRQGQRGGFWEGNWSPATKLVVGSIGATLLGNCLTSRRDPLTVALGFTGFLMLVRSIAAIDHTRGGGGRQQFQIFQGGQQPGQQRPQQEQQQQAPQQQLQGPNVPSHDLAPTMSNIAESDPMTRGENNLTDVGDREASMRNHI